MATPSPREARKLLGHRLALVRVPLESEVLDLKVLCADTYEWLSLQEACSFEDFPGWSGKFWTLTPGLVVISVQLLDIGTEDLDMCIQHLKASRADEDLEEEVH